MLTPDQFYVGQRITNEERIELARVCEGLSEGVNASLRLFLRYMSDMLEVFETQKSLRLHTVPVLMMYDFAEAVDGGDLLVQNGAARALVPLMRQSLEARLLLEYLTQDRATYEHRCLAYEFWHLKGERKWADRLPAPELVPDIEARMAHTRYDVVRAEEARMIEDARLRGRRRFKVQAWHQLWGGPSTIRDVAEQVGHSELYDYFYRVWSESVHGAAAVRRAVGRTSDTLLTHPLRHPKGLFGSAQFLATNCLELCMHLVRYYMPDRERDCAAYVSNRVLPKIERMSEFNKWG